MCVGSPAALEGLQALALQLTVGPLDRPNSLFHLQSLMVRECTKGTTKDKAGFLLALTPRSQLLSVYQHTLG